MPCKDWYFRKWATEDSDIHGMKHFARKKGGHLRKTIWLAFFLGAAGYFGYIATRATLNYFKYYHITKVDIEYEPLIEFPAVTVCNVNKYRESAINEHDIKNVGYHLGTYRFVFGLLVFELGYIITHIFKTTHLNRTRFSA